MGLRQMRKVDLMKKIMFALAIMSLATLSWADASKQTDTDRLDKAAEVLHQVMAAPDKGIPQEVMDHAKCVEFWGSDTRECEPMKDTNK